MQCKRGESRFRFIFNVIFVKIMMNVKIRNVKNQSARRVIPCRRCQTSSKLNCEWSESHHTKRIEGKGGGADFTYLLHGAEPFLRS